MENFRLQTNVCVRSCISNSAVRCVMIFPCLLVWNEATSKCKYFITFLSHRVPKKIGSTVTSFMHSHSKVGGTTLTKQNFVALLPPFHSPLSQFINYNSSLPSADAVLALAALTAFIKPRPDALTASIALSLPSIAS